MKLRVTPLPLNWKASNDASLFLKNSRIYRVLIGKLNFLTNSRPDMICSPKFKSIMQNPTEEHLAAVYHLLGYIKGIAGQGILLKASNKLSVKAFSDSS